MSLNKNHPRQARLRGIAAAAALLCLAASGAVQAQIVTDSSLGSAGQTLSGPAYSIPQSLGKLSGANLFHSFQTFNIGNAESATFSTMTPGIANVISRVSGGSRSQINGLLRLTAVDGTPGFFFINPAGVTFGAGAAIDVPGAFHVGSADHVVFPDGRFSADLNQASSFSSAAPQAFGFLGASRSAIELRDGAALISANGKAISLIAGDISIDNATLGSRAGSVRATAVGNQAAEVGFSGAAQAAAGNLTLSNGAGIISSSLGSLYGAALSLNAGRIDISGDSTVFSLVGGADSGRGGAIDIMARDALLLSSGGNISSNTDGAGNGGVIRVRAGEAALDSAAYLYSSSAPGQWCQRLHGECRSWRRRCNPLASGQHASRSASLCADRRLWRRRIR